MQRAAGGRETEWQLWPWSREEPVIGSEVGHGNEPRNHPRGGLHRPGAALLWDIPETEKGWGDAGSEIGGGTRWRGTRFRGKESLEPQMVLPSSAQLRPKSE